MTTMKDMIAETRRMTYGSMSEGLNLISTAAAAGATQIQMELDVTGITQGMTLSSGLNTWYVKGLDVATNTVFVIPGIDNSPAAAVEVGDMVIIKPRVTDWFLFETLNHEFSRLSSPEIGLYKIGSWTENVDPTYQTYDIPSQVFSDMIGLLRVRYRMPGTPDVWVDIPEKSYRFQVNADGARIRLLRNIPSGTEIQFLYKGRFSKATAITDDVVEDCGLTDTMTDIPPLGAYATLLRTTESRRNQVQTQGDARRAAEVQSGFNGNMSQIVERDYRSRVQEEMSRLTQRVPIARSL